ncbi:hypothetical protein B0H11DRAFT_1939943 [Mycena galericulata]|nr:hypothetical protein B0H11DRAFT_1939943 [Mycena galericulata]
MAIDDTTPDANAPAPLLALIQPATLVFLPLATSPHLPTTSVLSAIHRAQFNVSAQKPNSEHVQVLMALCDGMGTGAEAALRGKCLGALLAQHVDASMCIAAYLVSMLPTVDTPSPAGTEPMLQAAASLIHITRTRTHHGT